MDVHTQLFYKKKITQNSAKKHVYRCKQCLDLLAYTLEEYLYTIMSCYNLHWLKFFCSLSRLIFAYISLSLVDRVMASAVDGSVDSKAELTALLEQWEREQQGNTQDLVNILTK